MELSKMAKVIKSKKVIYCFLAVVLIAGLTVTLTASNPGQNPKQTTEPEGFVPLPDVVPVVFVSGTPEEMGFQYGFQAASYIQEVLNDTWVLALEKTGSEELVKTYLEKYESLLRENIPDFETRVVPQMQGIAEGCKAAGYDMSYTDILLLNSKTLFLWGVLPPVEELDSCSMFMAWGSATKDGKSIVGQWQDNNFWIWNYKVVMISYPAEGYGYATLSTPNAGNLVGEVWWMNEKGLTQTVSAGVGRRPEDRGFEVTYEPASRYVAQNSATTQEAIDFLTSIPFAMGANYGYIDAQGNAANAEITCAFHYVREPGDFGETDNIYSIAGHFIIPEALVGYGDKPRVGSSGYIRYFTIKKLIEQNFGSIDIDVAKEMMRNHDVYDLDKNKWSYNQQWLGNTLCRHYTRGVGGTMTNAIILPEDRVAYINSGTPCGTWGTQGATGGYARLALLDNPEAVTKDAQKTASLYLIYASQALDNVEEPTWSIWLRDRLEQAREEYFKGCNSLVDASLAEKDYSVMALLGQAATHFSKAQVYAEQVINKASGL